VTKNVTFSQLTEIHVIRTHEVEKSGSGLAGIVSDISRYKEPQTNDNYVGIEFEFLSPLTRDDIVKHLRNSDLKDVIEFKYEGVSHDQKEKKHIDGCSRTIKKKHKCDCAFRPNVGCPSWEIAILIKQSELKETLHKACTLLRNIDAFTSLKCGLHVHIDIRNRDAVKVYQNMILAQPLLFAIVPKWRRLRSYCCPINTTRYTDGEWQSYNRSVKYSAPSEPHKKTVEVRIYHGVLNFEPIFNWVNILLKIADSPKLTEPIYTVAQFAKTIPISGRERMWMLRKILRHGGYPEKMKIEVVLGVIPKPQPISYPQPMTVQVGGPL
jgi:hypothetical protein